MTQTPAKPAHRLVELLTQPDAMQKLLEMSVIVGPGPGAVIRTAMLMAGMRVPEEQPELLGFVASLLHHGWYAMPTALTRPAVGDLYVCVNERKEPVEVGVVAKFEAGDVSPEGKLIRQPEHFRTFALEEGKRWRQVGIHRTADALGVDYWLKLHGR